MRTRPVLSILPLVFVGLMGPGCSDDSSSDASPSVDCDMARETGQLQLCDITDESCQCYIYNWVSVQRDSELSLPPETNSITREEYIASLESGGNGGSDDPETDAFGEVLKFIGYNQSEDTLTDDENEQRGGSVAAFYRTSTEAVTIITAEGVPNDSERAVSLLAHEYTHAQQDSEEFFDYLNQRIYDSDLLLTARATLEGEAELIEVLALLNLRNIAYANWNWEAATEESQFGVIETALSRDNPYVYADLIFPYPFGLEMFAAAYFDEFDYALVLDQRQSFPTQTRQFLTEDYSDEARIEGYMDRIQQNYSLPDIPDAFELVDADPLTGWHFYLYLRFVYGEEELISEEDAFALSLQLDGEYIFTATREDGSIVGGWFLLMDDEDAAETFYDLLIENPQPTSDEWQVSRDGPYLTLAMGDSGEAFDEWASWLESLPADYDAFLVDFEGEGRKSLAAGLPVGGERPQLPDRIYCAPR